MTALIIFLAAWRGTEAAMRMRPRPLPLALDVALDHVVWLRLANPALSPIAAGALIGAQTDTWAAVVREYAAAWEALPVRARHGGNR
jgi:hypothetical protein